jgi:hypothetical protein
VIWQYGVTAIVTSVGLLKSLSKLLVLLVFAAVVAGVVSLVKSNKKSAAISYDRWPEVPRNPAA